MSTQYTHLPEIFHIINKTASMLLHKVITYLPCIVLKTYVKAEAKLYHTKMTINQKYVYIFTVQTSHGFTETFSNQEISLILT